jgi:hypothetical protein
MLILLLVKCKMDLVREISENNSLRLRDPLLRSVLDTDTTIHPHIRESFNSAGLIIVLRSMADADPSLDGLIGAPFVGASLDLGSMADADAILNGLIRAITGAASLDLGAMPNTNSTLYCLIAAAVMGATFDLGSVLHANTARLCLICAIIDRASGMSSFLTNSFILLDLGSMALAHTSTDGLVSAPIRGTAPALLLRAVLAATTSLLSKAGASTDGAAVDILSGLIHGRRWSNFTAEQVISGCRWRN